MRERDGMAVLWVEPHTGRKRAREFMAADHGGLDAAKQAAHRLVRWLRAEGFVMVRAAWMPRVAAPAR